MLSLISSPSAMKHSIIIILSFFLSRFSAYASETDCSEGNLMHDLMMVDYVNCYLSYQLPVTYNYFLQGGYFIMPSARVGCEGEFAFGYSSVPPYTSYNARFQFTDRLELSGNYRIFTGVDDPLLSSTGFGDKSDKGISAKLAIIHPYDSNYVLPGLAIGADDFLGTKSFEAYYVVATQVFPKFDLEMSVGYGSKRIHHWFGGAQWTPFARTCWTYLKGLTLGVEYDATHYKSHEHEQHPAGHKTKSPINFGLKYRLWDSIDCSLSYIRGMKLAFSFSAYYNLGMTQGFFPKVENPLLYKAPVNVQPLGPLRPDDVLVQDLLYPLREQGLELLEVWLSCDCAGVKTLRLRIGNEIYRFECDVRAHLDPIITNLIPGDIENVIVIVEGYGFPVNEYHYPMRFVRQFAEQEMGPYELHIISPITDVTRPPCCGSKRLFQQMPDWWYFELLPKTHTMFGSSRGKFKYALGFYAAFNGFLWSECYYSLLIGYVGHTNMSKVKDVDKLNPSQLINVRTDIVNYHKRKGFSLEEAYIQRNWNLGCGWYAKLAGGLFEIEYGGLAGEILFCPASNNWALGIEAATLRKRKVGGVSFTDKVRKLHGFQPEYLKFHGSQFFANFYTHFYNLNMDLEFKVGKFLANDWGVRTQICRYYPSGLRVFAWYTITNGNDRINGHRYYDKGIAFSLPLDIFFTYSSRQCWNYGMSAWLRDVGVTAYTGSDLYYLIQKERERP